MTVVRTEVCIPNSRLFSNHYLLFPGKRLIAERASKNKRKTYKTTRKGNTHVFLLFFFVGGGGGGIAERASKNNKTTRQLKTTKQEENQTHTVSKTQQNCRPNPNIPSISKPDKRLWTETPGASIVPSPPWRADDHTLCFFSFFLFIYL